MSALSPPAPSKDAAARRVAPGPSRPRRRSLARGVRVLCLALLLVPALWTHATYAREERVRAAARPYEFHLAVWESAELAERLPALLRQIAQPPPPDPPLAYPTERATVQEFFAAVEGWRSARARGASADDLATLRAAWQARAPALEAAVSRELAVLARQHDLLTPSPLGSLLLPPPSFAVTEPPRVLVLSPRDRVEVAQSVLLRPDLTLGAMEALEREVDAMGLSGLVIAIGGIATYPAIVPLQGSPLETLSAVAHEWLHGYLFFHPLGRAYFASYDARMVNETVADLAGRELGRQLADAYGLPTSTPARAGAEADPSGFDFRAEMRDTRLRLDALLATGQIAEAEDYLEAQRQRFVAAGYAIRKLNQAYFAFHGSYGESPAAVSPLDRQVRALRAASPDLGSFLRRVAQMTSSAEVAGAVGEPGEPS